MRRVAAPAPTREPGGHGDPQDQARDRGHAGEPLVRRVLRHLSGGRRAPAAERQVHRLRAGHLPAPLRQALPRDLAAEPRRAARAPGRGPRRQRRQDERLHHPGAPRPEERLPGAPAGAAVLDEARSRRDGLLRPARDPELLGLREALRAPGPHVRADHLMDPAGAPVHGLRVVGAVPPPQRPDELRQRGREPARAPSHAAEPDRPRAQLRLDRPDLPVAQEPRLLALLRVHRHGTGLRGGRDDLRLGAAEGQDARELEPTPVVHDRAPGQAGPKRRVHEALLQRRARGQASRRLLAHAQRRGERASAQVGQGGSGVCHERDQRGHAKSELVLERDLPRVGRLGRLLRPRRAARGRPERLRPARARAPDLAVREARRSSTTRS